MMQVYLTVRDELGTEVKRYPDPNRDREPLGCSIGPGGVIVLAVEIEYPGRYQFQVNAYPPTGP